MSGQFENLVLCPRCELEITDHVADKFQRDPGQKSFLFECPRCKIFIDIEVVPMPVFFASLPVGRIVGGE